MEYYKYLRQFVGHRPIILPGSVVLVFDSASEQFFWSDVFPVTLDFAGGMMDLGESFETVAIREVKEETNLTIRTLEFFKNYSGPSHHVVLENGDEMYVVTARFLYNRL
ncbi:NUDIX domain-containing protein [Erysipelothrix sp. D19-032]